MPKSHLEAGVQNAGPVSASSSATLDLLPPDEMSLDAVLRQADTHYAGENWPAARDSMELAASIAPANPQVLGTLGSLHFRLQDYRKACAAFAAAVRLSPDNPDLYVQLALCHRQLSQPAEAEVGLRRALALRPDDLTALKLLADCHLDRQLHQDAALIYGKLIDRHPDQAGVLLSLAKCFFCLGDDNGAMAALDQVLEIDPANEVARENRALLQNSAAAPANRRLAQQRINSTNGSSHNTAELPSGPGPASQAFAPNGPETSPRNAGAKAAPAVPGTINPSLPDLHKFYADAAVEFGEVEPPQLDEVHLQHSRILPSREHILPLLPKGGIAAEVGTQTGNFAKLIRSVVKPARLHLYDLDFSVFDHASFQPAVEQGLVVLHHGDSASLLATMPDQHFDFIYIDGDHSFEGAARDLAQAGRTIKPDGVIVCNDYTIYSPLEKSPYGVYRAVNEFCWKHGFEIVYLGLHHWGYHDVALRRMKPADLAAVAMKRPVFQTRLTPDESSPPPVALAVPSTGQDDRPPPATDTSLKNNLSRCDARSGSNRAEVLALTASPALDDPARLQQQFELLGPWFTKYTINGKNYGGSNSYAGDPRLSDFFNWCSHGGSVLELGSFEGAHSFAITAKPRIKKLVGLEGRQYLIDRAEFMRRILGNNRVQFAQCDFERDDITQHGRFDVVFCSGLLSHLAKPWELIEQISRVTDRFFLSTHYAEKREIQREGYWGILFQEGPYSDPLSGLVDRSFWPTSLHLVSMLTHYGFGIVQAKDYPDWGNAPLVNLYCEKKPS